MDIEAQKEIHERLSALIREKGIKEKVMNDVKDYAQRTAKIVNGVKTNPLPEFPEIDVTDPVELMKYYLVLEFIQSSGFKFSQNVLGYESRNPGLFVDRMRLADELGLRGYDKTPLLVQMIEEFVKRD